MNTAAAYAIDLERTIALDEGARFQSLARFFLGERETPAGLAARYRRLIIGAAEPLRQAVNEDEFRATFELLDGRAFLSDFFALFRSPAFPEMERVARAAELAPSRPQPRNERALALRDDLLERSTLLFPAPGPRPDPATIATEMDRLAAEQPGLARAIGRFLACAMDLTYAAFGREPWEPWQLGLLWTFGERALMAQAQALGMPPNLAVARTTTRRDRELMAQPIDQAASDQALALLGLNS